jgi:biotin operon repressor
MKSNLIKDITMWHLNAAHKGRSCGIKVEALARKVNVSQRDVRQAVSDLREDGVPVAATPATGYYIAQTADEVDECCQFLRRRAMHSLRLESRLRKVALPELLGQISLDVSEPPTDMSVNPITQFINHANQGKHHD